MAYDFLRPNEVVLKECAANKNQLLFAMFQMGKLILTNQRLIYKSFYFSFGSHFDKIELVNISTSGKGFNILFPSPNLLRIITTDGTTYEYVLPKSKVWANDISNAILNAKGVN